jgi:hypothetical protein
MAAAETARLIASLELKDQFSKQLGAAEGKLGSFGKTLDHTSGRAYRAGTQIGTGIKAGVAIAVAGIGVIASQVAVGLNSLVKLDDVVTQTNAVLRSTKGAAGENADAIRDLANKYEDLNATIDDTVIQSGENLLLTFTNIRKQAFEPTLLAALNMNQALGGGEAGLQGTIQKLGKALNDPVKGLTALGRVGITFTKQQKDQILTAVKAGDTFKAQGIILAELNKRFGGSFLAGGTTTTGKVAKFRDAIDDLQRTLATALLPVLGKVADKLSTFLNDPKVVKAVSDLGNSIAGLFSDENLAEGGKILGTLFDTAKAAAPVLRGAAEAMLGIVKTAVGLFRSLPEGIQQLAIGAFAVNKLTGGLVTNIAGGIFDAFKGLRGSTPATPMFVKEVGLPGGLPPAAGLGTRLLPLLGTIATKLGGLALVIGGLEGLKAGISTGGPTGAAIGAAGGAAVIGGAALLAGPLGAIAASIGVVGKTLIDIRGQSASQGQSIADAIGKQISGGATTADLQTSLAAVEQGINDIQANPLNVLVAGDALDQLRAQRDLLQRQIDQGLDSPAHIGTAVADKLLDSPLGKISPATITAGITAGLRNEFRQMIAAIKSNKPADVVAGIRKAVDQLITKAGGSVSTTKETISALRTALGNTHDPKLQATIRAALAKVEAKLPGREYAARAQRQLDGMLSDGKLSTSELKKIKGVEQALKDRGLPHAADVIGRHVDSAKRAQVAAAHNTSEAIRKKRLAVTVNNSINTHVTVNSRDVFTRQRQYSKLFATAQ